MDDSTERWRGAVAADLVNLKQDLATLLLRHEKLDLRGQALELRVQILATKIGLFASLGAFLGSGLMALVISYFKHF